MSTILSERVVNRTRRYCRCDWCGEEIKKDDRSVLMSAIWEGDFHSTRFHPECHKAWKDTDWSVYEDWAFGEQGRGQAIQEVAE